MTCIDKLRELHPDWDDEKVRYHIDHNCPHAEYILPRPLNCGAHGWEDSDDEDCEKCWNRELPEIVDNFRHESLLYLTGEDMRRIKRLAERTEYSRDKVVSAALLHYEHTLEDLFSRIMKCPPEARCLEIQDYLNKLEQEGNTDV